MKELSTADKARIKSAFEKLGPGDVIGRNDVSLVAIRYIGDRVVIGVICGCEKRHVNTVFDDTFIWSNEKEALVGDDDEPPFWWSNDLSVQRMEATDIAEKSIHFPVSADYRQYTEAEKEALSDEKNELLLEAVKLLSFSDSKKTAMRRVLESFGVTLSDEQAMLMEIALERTASIEEALVKKAIFLSLLSRAAGIAH